MSRMSVSHGSPTELQDYRDAVRSWLRSHAPAAMPTGADLIPEAKKYQAALFDAGYAGITWPTDVGGQGLSPAHQQVFSDEAAAFEVPTHPFAIGMGMCGP